MIGTALLCAIPKSRGGRPILSVHGKQLRGRDSGRVSRVRLPSNNPSPSLFLENTPYLGRAKSGKIGEAVSRRKKPGKGRSRFQASWISERKKG